MKQLCQYFPPPLRTELPTFILITWLRACIMVRMSENIYWIQHAPVFKRKKEIVGSGTDRELQADGIEQAKTTADRIAGAAISGTLQNLSGVVVTSPLKRAVRTAEEIADRLDFEVKVDDDLRAQHFGVLEGMTAEEVLQVPELAPHLHRNLPEDRLYADVAPGGESIESACLRLLEVRGRLLGGERGNDIAVTHGSVLNTLIGVSRSLAVPEWKDISANYRGGMIQDSGGEVSALALPE